MRKTLTPEIEHCRKAGPKDGGPYGVFELLHPVTGRRLRCIASDGRDWAEPQKRPTEEQLRHAPPAKREIVRKLWGDMKEVVLPSPAWEHVTVSTAFGCPRWEEMCFVKDAFWDPGELVLQLHVPTDEHLSIHDFVLHLWKPVGVEIPMPPKICV